MQKVECVLNLYVLSYLNEGRTGVNSLTISSRQIGRRAYISHNATAEPAGRHTGL